MSAKNRKNNFLVQGSILAAASLIVRIIGLLYRIPMVNIIGDEANGIYTNTYEVYNIALILSSYSLPLAVSKLVAVRNEQKEHKNSYRVFVCAMGFGAAVGLVATLAILFGADFIEKIFYTNTGIALPLRVLAPTIFVFAIMGVLRGLFQGKNTMIPTAVSQILEQIVNAAVSIIATSILVKNYSASLDVSSYGAAGGTLGTLVGACVGLLFLLFIFIIYKPMLKKQLRKDTDKNRESYQDIFKLLLLTVLPVVLSQTVYQISGLIDGSMFTKIMMAKPISAFELKALGSTVTSGIYSPENTNTLIGLYSGKYRLLTNVPVAIATAMAAAIVVSLTADKTNGRMDSIRKKAHAAIKFNMIIAIPAAVGMGVLAYPILDLIYNTQPDRTQLTANLMQLGSVSIIFFALSSVTTAILQGINRMRVPVINSAISLGIHVVLIFCLLKFTSLSSYALVIGNVTFALSVSVLNWISVARYLEYRQEIVKTFLIPTISAGFMGVAAYFVYQGFQILTGRNWLAVLIAIVVAVIVYFALLLFMKGVDEDELEFLPKSASIIRFLKKLRLL